MWTANYLAQASCTELTLLSCKISVQITYLIKKCKQNKISENYYPVTVETNLNVISMQRSVWQSLAIQDDFNILKYDIMKETDCHVPALVYKGQTIKDAGEFGEDYEINDTDTIDAATKQIEM